MKMLAFAARNRKELLRDPLSLVFGIGFPVVLVALISLMNRSIPGMADVFEIENFAPGMAVFGMSFLSLFLGLLLANDRGSSFLTRLFASPMRGVDYLMGYTLPLLPMAAAQSVVCFFASALFGLKLSGTLVVAVAVLAVISVLFIGLGLLLGSVLSAAQVGGVASILINVCAWLSGTWFPLELIGGTFARICYVLPFAHAVDATKAAVAGNFAAMGPHLLWVVGYAAVVYLAAVAVFQRKMKT